MMFHFPRDCFADASGVLLTLFEVLPQETIVWVRGTVGMLPAGSVKAGEADRLINGIRQHIQTGDLRKVRVQLQGTATWLDQPNYPGGSADMCSDFANSYRRRNIAPREGLGRLEATRFRFAG